MVDLNAMVLFARIVAAGSFSEAARRLKMPVSTVSRRVADLENRLGVRLLERSTRRLRLTEVGADILDLARRGADVSDAIEGIVSDRRTDLSGTLRLAAPPSLSDALIAPLVGSFQMLYPEVRVQVFVTSRPVDHIADGIDVSIRIGAIDEALLVRRRVLTYRHVLVATPDYLARRPQPAAPHDLLEHRLLAFSFRQPQKLWTFVQTGGSQQQTLSFVPHFEMNDYAGLAQALLAGAGIGDLPPVVLPELTRDGRLVEVMPDWRFEALDLSLVHLGNRHLPRLVRVFEDHAVRFVPTLFPALPT